MVVLKMNSTVVSPEIVSLAVVTLPQLAGRELLTVKRIFDGTNLGHLPVEHATRIGLVVNPRTADALGLAVPASLLAQADEVIE